VGSTQSEFTVRQFRARTGLSGGHRQTIASFLLPRRFSLPEPESRLVEVAPGIQVLCQCHWQADKASAMTIVILHGLEGSSDSNYAKGITEKGLARGMSVVRMNQRNCGGTENLAPTLYHSGLSSDVAAVVRNLTEVDGVRRIALVGFSMGGNIMLKLAGEWGSEAPQELRCVAAVCPAMDLAASADALHDRSNRLYEIYFLMKLRQRLRAKARLFPLHFDVSRLNGVKSLRDFDDKVTAYYCGFSGAVDYYARAAAANVLDRIAAPTLILHAANDPFIRITPATRAKAMDNPHITFVETNDGGHCSFIASRDGYDGHWAEQQVLEFVSRFRE
jgi:predicted alpha/beta-fold hydrolase